MSEAIALVRLLEELEREGTTVMDLVGAGRHPRPWTLYPGEYGIFDRSTGSQFYYHTHADGRDEAGHFHAVRFAPTRMVHLVAISMTERGWPQALFTVNLWAIGDSYVAPALLRKYVRAFHIGERRADRRLVRFANLMFAVFRAEIEDLQEEKVQALARYRIAHPHIDPFEDRSVEILSRRAIDVPAHLPMRTP